MDIASIGTAIWLLWHRTTDSYRHVRSLRYGALMVEKGFSQRNKEGEVHNVCLLCL